MSTETETLLAGLRRVHRRMARIELALLSERTRERNIERRREARLKYVVGGDVVAGANRGEPDAKTTLAAARDRARERDQALFEGRVPAAAKAPEPAASGDEARPVEGSG